MNVVPTLAILAALSLCHAAVLRDGQPTRWALLVAGSNDWWNYRHQADICHAYQILKQNIPEENIITLMYDDIAQNEDNPNPGVIINKPDGPNVYEGVKIDYRGDDVNPTNFLNILQGNKSAMENIGTGRVIESGPDDIVFVNFADHGAAGLLAFPSEYLYANDLEAAFSAMASNNQFKELVFYVEACEAGSMFENLLPSNTNIFVSTASNADESSWGWYCDNPLGTCLGDLYSINWMEHMDSLLANGTGASETLEEQYEIVKTATTESHVTLYGDLSLSSETVGNVFGLSDTAQKVKSFKSSHKTQANSGVLSRDVPLRIVQKKLEKAQTLTEKIVQQKTLKEIERKRQFVDDTIAEILSQVANGKAELISKIEGKKNILKKEDYVCYKNVLEKLNELCFDTFENTYLIGHFYKFANLCTVPWANEKTVELAMSVTCTDEHRNSHDIL